MPSERQKMLKGELYHASAPRLARERQKARELFGWFNHTLAGEAEERQQILKKLIPRQGKGLYIEPPFYCDYGYNVHIGNNVYFNFNCTVLDVMPVTIGSHTMFGPSVQIYAATHPMDWEVRTSGLEMGKAISIGSYVWVGGGAIICPGVTIGDRSVIGAGSVVTRDIPAGVFAAGNPCRVIRQL